MADLELIRDFVNTAELDADTDDLRDAAGLVRWLADHRLAGPLVRGSERDAADARAVREALRELLRSNNGVDADRDAASATLDASARRAGLGVRFDGGSMQLTARAGGVVGGVALVLAAAAEAMADGSWQRLKACRNDECRWAFVDSARNRSRRWCDMSACGNRAKVRRFRSRNA